MISISERELEVKTVLEYCDGPLLFTAEDAAESTYLCAYLRTSISGTEYLCTRVGASIARRFISGGEDLRTSILEAPLAEHFLLTTTEEDVPLMAYPININSIDQSLLPAPGYFVPELVGASILSDERVVIEASLEVKEAKEAPVISSDTLAALLRTFQDLLKHCYKKGLASITKPSERRYLASPDNYTLQVFGMGDWASFGVKLRTKSTADLFRHVDFERALEKVNLILKESNDIEKTLDALRANKGHLVGSYRRFLAFLIESKASLRIKWHPPRSEAVTRRVNITYEEAKSLQDALSQQTDLDDEIVEIVGVVTHLNTATGAWTIKDEEGHYHKGDIQPRSGITLGGITSEVVTYTFHCKEEMKEDAMGKEVTRLLLFNYEPATA